MTNTATFDSVIFVFLKEGDPLLNVAPHLPSMNVEHNVTSKKLIRKVLLQSKKAKCPVNQMDCLLHTINSMVPEITYGHDEHTQLS